MNKEEAFAFLNRLADGISKTLGNNCETVIHDIKNETHSIVAIYNGHVTGRKVGDKLDLLGSKENSSELYNNIVNGIDYINCQGVNENGNLLKSSTFYLAGEDYHYALGINFDYTSFFIAENALKEFMKVGKDVHEAINESGEVKLAAIFEECLHTIGKPISMMNKDDKIKLAALLNERNAFSIQKSIPFISKKMHISRSTLYSYLSK